MSMDATADWPFVGRESELATISSLASDVDVAGVTLHGPAGIGRTRLARQALSTLATSGWHVEWVAASRAAASIPFGAVAHLLPPGWRSDGHPMTVVRAVADHMRACGGRSAAVVAVDDAQLLDDASATVVGHLAATGAAFMLITVRTGQPVPDVIMSQWTDGTARRLGVSRLTATEVDALLDRALGPMDGVSRQRLHRAADGNPSTLRDLVRSGIDGGTLRQRYGFWCWDPEPSTTSTVEPAADRALPVAPAVRLVLELVALGAPLELATLESIVDEAAIQAAEDGGLIVVERSGRRVEVGLARPLCGEAIRAALPLWRARQCYRRLAEAALATPMRRRDDALRVAVWQVASGVVADPGVVVRGAEQARHGLDLPLAERLARAVRDASPSPDADRLLAEILQQRGCHAEAAAILPAEPPIAGDRSGWAVARAETLFWGTGDVGAAERVLRSAADGSDVDLIDGARSRILLFDGRCAESLAIAERVLHRPGADEQAVLWAATAATAAAGFLGRYDEACAAYRRGSALVGGQGTRQRTSLRGGASARPLWTAVELGYAGCLAHLVAGDLRVAWTLSEDGYREAVAAHATSAAGGWAALRGMIAATQGRLALAGRSLREAAASLEDGDGMRLIRLCLACLGAVAGLAGEADAESWLERADRRPGHGDRLFAPWVEKWRAWSVAASRSATEATAAAEDAARRARVADVPTIEAATLYDVVRFGGGVPARMAAVVHGLRTPLAGALLGAANGLAGSNADALAEATTTLDGLGHQLLAAEVAAAAGRAYRHSGRRGSARLFAEKAALLRASCAGVRTPLLEADGVTEVLTPREREVLLLAAGHTSPEIAQRLGLSPRTIDNNLNRAYAKLGVSGRHELRVLLGDGTTHPAGI